MKKFLLFFWFCTISLHAQPLGKEYFNWYFGEGASISFNTYNFEPINAGQSSMFTLEGSASISDIEGNLLFYTDGVKVWDRNNTVMPNGTGLKGDYSATQSALILRKPGSNHLYYIFTVDKGPYGRQSTQEFCYSVVDVSLNNNFGDVTLKNQVIHNRPVTEKLTAIMHSNNEDYWVISHEMDTPNYVIALLTSNGIASVKTQRIGPSYDTRGGEHADVTLGYLKGNRKGDRLAAVVFPSTTMELYKFDRSTGILSDYLPITIDKEAGYYGLEFSPSGQFIYTANVYRRLLQFDISVHDADSIESSRQVINDNYNRASQSYGSLQLAPNDRIYMSVSGSNRLAVIARPDLKGALCAFQLTAFPLTRGRCQFGLPNYCVTEYVERLEIIASDACERDTIRAGARIIPQIGNYRYIWTGPNNFKSESDHFKIPNARDFNTGYYVVEVYEHNFLRFKDSVFITVHPYPVVKISAPNIICPPETIKLGISQIQPGVTYTWFNGDIGFETEVSHPGQYFVVAKSPAGCTDTVYHTIYLSDKLDAAIMGPRRLCDGDTITLTANKSSEMDFVTYRYYWSSGDTTRAIKVNKAGKYWLEIYRDGGCRGFDTIEVTNYPKPEVEFTHEGNIILCESSPIQISVKNPRSDYQYTWSDGFTGYTRIAERSGFYRIYATNGFGCLDSAETEVILISKPNIFIKFDNDLTFCTGDSILIDVKYGDEDWTIIWNDGHKSPKRIIKESGIYKLVVENIYGCKDSAEFEINVLTVPKPEIIPSRLYVCRTDTVTLTANSDYYAYLWSDGSTSKSTVVKGPGIYKLKVFNEISCSDSTEVEIKLLEAEIKFDQNTYVGEIACTDETVTFKIELRNITEAETIISELYTDDTDFRIVSHVTPFTIQGFGSESIFVEIKSPKTGIFGTRITAVTNTPCYDITSAELRQQFTAQNQIRLPDISAQAGESICIPVYAKVICGLAPLESQAVVEIAFDAEYFHPISMKSGAQFQSTIKDGICIVTINYPHLLIDNNEKVIDEICGSALIGNSKPSPLSVKDGRWEDSGIELLKIDGSIALEACVIDLRSIRYFQPTSLSVAPNPAFSHVELTIVTQEIGTHRLDIFDLAGNVIKTYEFENSENTPKIHTISLFSRDIQGGFYIIRLISPWKVIFEKMLIGN
jgi:hypothetical protein